LLRGDKPDIRRSGNYSAKGSIPSTGDLLARQPPAKLLPVFPRDGNLLSLDMNVIITEQVDLIQGYRIGTMEAKEIFPG
jgi:hypothetical protein